MTHLQRIIQEAKPKSNFLEYIGDTYIKNQQYYQIIINVLEAINDKFGNMANISLFAEKMNSALLATELHNRNDIRDYQEKPEKFPDGCKILPLNIIESIMINTIKKAKKLEKIKFIIDNNSKGEEFNTLNKYIAAKKFNPIRLSTREKEIVKRQQLFSVDDIETWLNTRHIKCYFAPHTDEKYDYDTRKNVLEYYYNQIKDQ